MKITSIQVDGFGSLNKRHHDLTAGLTVFHGANEAGKSTLLAFIRAVLFGFPPRSQPAERYEPPKGGIHGGALFLEDDQGKRIRVERYAGGTGTGSRSAGSVKVTFTDGSTGGEEELRALMGGLSAELFRSLFAFGLGELQELRTLQSEELSGYLYSAGLGLSGSAIIAAGRKLNQDMDQLYKPRGKNQLVNQGLIMWDELRLKIRKVKEHLEQYDEWNNELSELEESIVRAEEEYKEISRETEWIQLCLKIRPSWLRLKQIDRQLNEFPPLRAFPRHAVTRWESLQKEADDQLARIRNCTSKRDQVRTALMSLPIREEPWDEVELERLAGQGMRLLENQKVISGLEAELEQVQKEMDRRLQKLDEDWTEADLETFPATIGFKETVRSFKKQFDEMQEKRRELGLQEDRLSDLTDEAYELVQNQQLELNEWKKQYAGALKLTEEGSLSGGIPDSSTLHAIAKDYASWKLLSQEVVHQKQRLADLAEAERKWSERRRQERNRVRSQTILFTVLPAAAILVTALFLQIWWLAAGSFVLLGAASFIFLRFQGAPASHGKHRGAHKENSVSPDLAESGAWPALEVSEQQLFHLQQKIIRAVQELIFWEETAASLDSGTGHGTDNWSLARKWLDTELDAWITELDQSKTILEEYGRKNNRLEEAMKQLDRLGQQSYRLGERKQAAADERKQLMDNWQNWLGRYRLRVHLSPEAVLECLSVIEQGQETIRTKHSLKNKLALMRSEQSEYQVQAENFLRQSYPDLGELVAALKKARKQAEEQKRLIEQKQLFTERIDEWEEEIRLLQIQLSHVQERMKNLLAEAGAGTDEELRRLANLDEERGNLQKERQLLYTAVEAQIGPGLLAKLNEELEGCPEEKLAERLDSLKEQKSRLESSIHDMREQRGRLAGELDKLEHGDGHAVLLQRQQEEIARLQIMSERYAILSMASQLIRKARDRYEEERQPGVLKKASEYFAYLTDNRYVQIRAPLGEPRLSAITSAGEAVDTGFLSRGTAEQLYLSMRFALADEYRNKAVLPLILDDIFVNFDPVRTRRCLGLLKILRKDRQILLFTCHSHIRDAVQQMLPDSQIVEM